MPEIDKDYMAAFLVLSNPAIIAEFVGLKLTPSQIRTHQAETLENRRIVEACFREARSALEQGIAWESPEFRETIRNIIGLPSDA